MGYRHIALAKHKSTHSARTLRDMTQGGSRSAFYLDGVAINKLDHGKQFAIWDRLLHRISISLN